jgi:hypothetical protein
MTRASRKQALPGPFKALRAFLDPVLIQTVRLGMSAVLLVIAQEGPSVLGPETTASQEPLSKRLHHRQPCRPLPSPPTLAISTVECNQKTSSERRSEAVGMRLHAGPHFFLVGASSEVLFLASWRDTSMVGAAQETRTLTEPKTPHAIDFHGRKTNSEDDDAWHLVTRRGGAHSGGLTPAAAIRLHGRPCAGLTLVSALLPVKQTGSWSERCRWRCRLSHLSRSLAHDRCRQRRSFAAVKTPAHHVCTTGLAPDPPLLRQTAEASREVKSTFCRTDRP